LGITQKAIFKLENVSKTFGDKDLEVKAIDNVSLEIYEGEVFGIIGMSGAGKSTLVRTLNRLESATSGKIFFDGEDMATLNSKNLRQVRHSIGMIFQNFNLLNQKKILDNVIIPLKIAGEMSKKDMLAQARGLLKTVGIADKEKSYPSKLSGGQKQRVAIARALVAKPKVLLCDEATSALDPKTTGEILELLKSINKETGITIVIITHEMAVIEKICDRVAIMSEGKLAEIGNVSDIFKNPQTKAARQLVYPQEKNIGFNPFDMTDKRCIRIVFDGMAASEPVIANLVKETGETVNILSANTRSVGGIGYGQMIVELPKDNAAAEKVLCYLKQKGVVLSEVVKEGNNYES